MDLFERSLHFNRFSGLKDRKGAQTPHRTQPTPSPVPGRDLWPETLVLLNYLLNLQWFCVLQHPQITPNPPFPSSVPRGKGSG